MTHSRCESALDLVQTRACRIDGSNDNDGDVGTTTTTTTTTPVRFLAPVFDLINHDRDPNAEFIRKGDALVVRAKRDIPKDSQIQNVGSDNDDDDDDDEGAVKTTAEIGQDIIQHIFKATKEDVATFLSNQPLSDYATGGESGAGIAGLLYIAAVAVVSDAVD